KLEKIIQAKAKTHERQQTMQRLQTTGEITYVHIHGLVMDKDSYKNKMEELLHDSNTYHILKNDPTEQLKRTLKSLLKLLLAQNKITQCKQSSGTTATITPQIYRPLKIHKTGTTLHPIVDNVRSLT
ncbi:hypothetical protein NQD34_012387, partial [Periophthalmus magnuspinnatus]